MTINLVVTGRGDFKGRMTLVDMRRMRVVRCEENLPRVAYVTFAPGPVFVAFPTRHDPRPVWSGVEMRPGDIVFQSRGDHIHQRNGGAAHWGFISLAPEHLAAYGRALSHVNLTPPRITRFLRPPSADARELLRLHARACRLAETKPEMIAHREVARSLEQDLLLALAACLTVDEAHEHAAARQRHARIMARFEDVLASHSDAQPPTSELAVAVGVSEETLRKCCSDFLGMNPGQYARLRRLNLVCAALRRADPATTSIAEIARQYGFPDPGRFATTYRGVFGETPSATLRGRRSRVPAALSAEFA